MIQHLFESRFSEIFMVFLGIWVCMPMTGIAQELDAGQEIDIILQRILGRGCVAPAHTPLHAERNGDREVIKTAINKESFLKELPPSVDQGVLISRLREIAVKGPGPESLERYKSFYQKRWKRMRAFYQSSPEWLREDYVARKQKQIENEDEYVNHRLDQLKRKYQSNAKMALSKFED